MLTHIKIERFRGFTSLETDLRLISVIVGPNSSGKTSLLHAVRIASEALAMGLEEAAPHLEKDGKISVCRDQIVYDFARLHPVDDWAELFTNRVVGEGTSPLLLELRFDEMDVLQLIRVRFSYGRNYQLKMSVTVQSRAAHEQVETIPVKSKFRSERLRELLKQGVPKAVFVPAFYGVTRAEEYRTRALVARLLGGGDQSRIVRNLVAQLTAPAFERLKDFLRRSIGATLVNRTTAQEAESVQYLKVFFQDTNGSLELSSAGAGLVNLIALYTAMEQFRPDIAEKRPVVFLLDEPEAHLHPKLQGDVGEALGQMAAEFSAQLLVATHSIEMINRMGQRPDTLLLAVDRATSTATKLDSDAALVREVGQWCDLTPFTSLNFLASRQILFHEGPSDDEILTQCAMIYFRNDLAKLARLRAWTFVPLHGAGNVKAQGVLRAVLTPKLFPALGAGRKVRAVCVLDRDAEREPGLRQVKELSKDHFEASELVWSRYSIESLFLEPACLAAWLAAVLPDGAPSGKDLEQLAAEGLAKADQDTALLDAAEVRLAQVNLRAKGMKIEEALRKAKEDSRASPATWQQGKGRASVVLKYVREQFPKNLQNQVRGTIVSLVEAGGVKKLGEIKTLVPEEIRRLLDLMVAQEE